MGDYQYNARSTIRGNLKNDKRFESVADYCVIIKGDPKIFYNTPILIPTNDYNQ